MALNVKFSTVAKAIISTTGNTAIISYNNSGSPSGAMITPTGGTTRDWNENGSKAYLNIKLGSTILYAELVWYSTVKQDYYGGTNLITNNVQDNPIQITFPSGHIENVPPGSDTNDKQNFSEENGQIVHRYRSANVTDIMKSYGVTGMYTVAKIPTSLPTTDIAANTRCGWTLMVVYQNPTFKVSVISLNTGLVSVLSTPLDFELGNFSTPSIGTPRGLLTVVAADGDTSLYPDTFSVGPNFTTLTQLGNSVTTPNASPGTAPNNPKNNFLAAQINIADPTDPNMGLIDTRGTLGNNNNNAFVPELFQGARCKWDITCVDFSNTLHNNQTNLAVRCNNEGGEESNEIIAIGIIIEARSPDLNVEKSVNKTDVVSGDEVQYTITINNVGDTVAQDAIITDPMQGGQYVSGSLTVDNVANSGNIETGVNIGNIGIGGSTIVSFKVKVASNAPNVITNQASVKCKFIPSAGQQLQEAVVYSNQTSINLYTPVISLGKSANRTTVLVGDIVTFTISAANLGTVVAQNVTITEQLPSSLKFIENSIMIGATSQPGLDLTNPILIENIDINAIQTLKFQAEVLRIPSSGDITNYATCNYTYQIGNPPGPSRPGSSTSNTYVLVGKEVSLLINKSVNRQYVTLGDILTYQIDIQNNGNVVADNTRFTDTLPGEVQFKTGTFRVNDDSTIPSTANPTTGVDLGTFNLNRNPTITFEVEVISLPTNYNILNTATIQGNFIVDSGVPIIEKQFSDDITTGVKSIDLTIEKTSDRTTVTQGDIIKYTVNINNTGTATADSVVFTDILKTNTTLVPDSFTINGMVNNNADLTTGVNLGSLNAGSSVEVKYKVKIENAYSEETLINTANAIGTFTIESGFPVKTKEVTANTTVQVKSIDLTIEKTSDRTIVTQGDIITYTANINNTGTATSDSVVFTDILKTNTTLVPDSFTINGRINKNPDLITGVNLGSLNAGSSVEVKYKVKVENAYSEGTLINTAKAIGTFKIESGFLSKIKEITSSDTVKVKDAILNVEKTADKIIAEAKDIITYKILIKNIGNISASKVVFTDILSSDVTFIPGSLSINNIQKTQVSINDEIDLGPLSVNSTIIIKFKIMINENFEDLQLTNTTNVKGIFRLEKNSLKVYKEFTDSNIIDIKNINLKVEKFSDRLTATQGDIIIYTVVIKNIGIIDAEEIIFTDKLNPSIEFIRNSFVVNDVPMQDVNPGCGINLGRLDINGITIIAFKIKINSNFSDKQLINIAEVKGKFKLHTNLPSVERKFLGRNIINVKRINLTIEKLSDISVAIPGSIVNYEVVIKNVGDVPAQDILFIDNLNLYTKFIENSLSINNIVKQCDNPNSGIQLGRLDINDIIVIRFKIKINDNFPDDNLINWVNVESQFIIDSKLPKIFRKFGNRNIINIKRIDLNLKSSSSEAIAREGDTITCKIFIKNNASIPADQINFQYYFNSYTTLIENSLMVNDVIVNQNIPLVELEQDMENYFDVNVMKSYQSKKKSFNENQIGSNAKNSIDCVEINLGSLDIEDTMNILFKVKVIRPLPINGIYDMIKIKGIFSLMPYIQPTTKIFEIIFKINPYLEKDCIIVDKVFSYCEKRFCLKNIKVNLQGKYIFKNIKFKSAQLEESTLKITPLEDRPSFSRVQFVAKVPYEITVKLIDSKEEKVFDKMLPNIYVDSIMFASKYRNEFKYKIALDSISKLISEVAVEDDELKFSVGVILVNNLVGKVQLSILSNGVYYNQCKCEEYSYIKKSICNKFKKYKYKDFFDI